MKRFALAFAALSLIAMPGAVEAKPCKDAKGKFIKCPTAAAPKATPPKAEAPKPAPKKAPCRDSKGRFIKCK